MGDPKVAGDADFRKALSMAIPRKDVAKEFGATRTPVDSFVPPPTQGAGHATCGKFCRYDPAGARAALARARAAGFTPPKTFALYYNADGGHGEWSKEVAAAIVLATYRSGSVYNYAGAARWLSTARRNRP